MFYLFLINIMNYLLKEYTIEKIVGGKYVKKIYKLL